MTPYILYNGEKVYVTIEGYDMTNTGLKVNVKAVEGFPFNGQNLESRGDYSGGSFPTCNGWSTYAYNVKFESQTDDSMDIDRADVHAVDEAYAMDQLGDAPNDDDWQGTYDDLRADMVGHL